MHVSSVTCRGYASGALILTRTRTSDEQRPHVVAFEAADRRDATLSTVRCMHGMLQLISALDVGFVVYGCANELLVVI